MGSSLKQKIYSVSELTFDIKDILEERYSFLWIFGEISNFRIPASGHFYFTLKDEKAQINCVMFRGQNKNLKFVPEDGMEITGLGRISVYEPRGVYQIIFEYMEPKGVGELQAAFEQLKEKLAARGFFDKEHKKPLPFLPEKIGIITSPTGAVIHDIIKVTTRRFPNRHIIIAPVKVQGDRAENEIARAFSILTQAKSPDIIILARGGGSLEDFHAFNSEAVAKAIFNCPVPVVTGIGHETDFTIADFVADLRAPTPSAAAEIVLPVKNELIKRNQELFNDLVDGIYKYIDKKRDLISLASKRIIHPGKKTADIRLKLDDLYERLVRAFSVYLKLAGESLLLEKEKLFRNKLSARVSKLSETVENKRDNLISFIRYLLQKKKSYLLELSAKLKNLDPALILKRGYSITTRISDGKIISDPESVNLDELVNVRVSKGSIICRVERKKNGFKTIV